MKLGVATGDWVEGAVLANGDQILGGSGWIRLGQYQTRSTLDNVIGELSWHANEEVFGVRTWDKVDHNDCDIILMQRWMHKSIPDRIRKAQANGQVILNDMDDWFWGLSEKNMAFHSSHPKVNPDENIIHFRKTLAASDGVIVSTEYLADRLSSFVPAKKIHLLENHVEIDKFTPRVHTESELPVIGWLGSTGHRHGDLDILRALYRQTGDRFGYHHSGHIGWLPHFYNVVGLGKDDVTILLAVPPQKLDEQFVFDIGVVPLVMAPFNQAKSNIKGLEYTSAGVPFVASPSIEYKKLKKNYGVGRLAKNVGQWVKHMEALRDPKVRQEEAEAARYAIQPLDVHFGVKKWDDIISSFA